MKSTERKASAGMLRFVLTIFGIALIIVAIYFVLLMPREPKHDQAPPQTINQGAP